MKIKFVPIVLILVFSTSSVLAQTAEIKLTFNERFFDALLVAVFTKLEEPSVMLSSARDNRGTGRQPFERAVFKPAAGCDESVRLKREIDGVRTAVRFRGGKIYAPIAFKGNYNPPLIGCIEFQGWAETNIELAFDSKTQALAARARVLRVNLSGAGGIGSGLIARMVQSSIDKKVNPIRIIVLDKLSFTFPVRNSGSLRMIARSVRHRIDEKVLEIFIKYEFEKAK